MNAKTQMKTVLIAMTGLATLPAQAADPASQGTSLTGEVTAKLYAFDYFKGSGANTQYLERYDYQQAMGGNNRSGGYPDFDLSLVANDAKRDVFVLERQGFGAHNHRGMLKADSDRLGFAGYYSHFRTATHGLNFLYSPGGGVVGGTDPLYAGNVNTGYVAQFSNDSPGQAKFKVDRTTYGMSLALKPTLLGQKTVAAFALDGYKRDGNRFATYILGNGDVNAAGANANRVLERWRGFDKPVEEKLNRYTLNLSGAPAGFVVAYEGSLEKFDNRAKTFAVSDFAANIQASGNAVVLPAILPRAIHFAPDSTLVANNLRLAGNFGSTAVATGLGLSVLDQDSFSQEQQDAGYNKGKITTSSAYLNVTSHAISGVGVEGFVKYGNRKNGSTFPAVGLLDPANGEQLAVRLARMKTLSYGLAASFRPGVWKSSVTVGWKHEDKDRDLTWSDLSAATSIQPHESLYQEKTRSDELYVNWIARPMPGMIVRVTPAYVTADQTGLVTEPEKAFSLKSKLSYTAKNGMMASGYYNYKQASNANNALTDSTVAGAPAANATKQDTDKTQQAAGVSLNLPFGEWVNTSASLSWMQDDFASYFLRSNRRRYEGTQNVLFANADRSNYKIDTYVFTLGGDWKVTDLLRYNGGYTWSQSKGNTASGYILDRLSTNNTIDGTLNNSVHTLTLGADYEVSKKLKLKGSYAYDYYTDKSYTALSGGSHTLMMGVAVGF